MPFALIRRSKGKTWESLARTAVVFFVLLVGLGVGVQCAGARTHRRAHGPRLPAGSRAHVDTWAVDDGCNEGAGARPRLVRAWVTYAESNCGPFATKARVDCHAHGRSYCQVMQYLDSDWHFAADTVLMPHVASSSWRLHAPFTFANIYSNSFGGGYLMNQLNPAVRSFFQGYVRAYFDSDDGLLMDWQSPSFVQELYYSTCGCSATREISSDAMLRAAHGAMAAAMTHRDGTPFLQADNSLPPNPYLPQGFDMLNHATGVDGWVAEGQPESDGTLDPYYSTLLDQMAFLAQGNSSFVVLLSYGPAGASYQQQSRRIQEATVLLGFRSGHVVDWANLEQGSRDLAVWPEEGIVPTDPVESMGPPGGRGCLAGTGVACSRGGHNNLQVAPGVYRRVFRRCYRRGIHFGACAVIVNTTDHPITVRRRWLRGARLRHQITMLGGDVQSGGRVDAHGAPFSPGSTVLGSQDAILLAS